MKNKSFPTLEKVIEITTAGLRAEANNIAVFESICEILAKFEDKPVNKRFVTALEAHFGPMLYCVLQNQHINIPSISLYGPAVPGHTTYETRFYFFLPCHEKSRQPFTVANLREANPCFGAPAGKRAETRANDLAVVTPLRRAAIAVDNFLAAQAELQESLAILEDRHEIKRQFNIDNDYTGSRKERK